MNTQELETTFKNIQEGWIVLLETGADRALSLSMMSIKLLLEAQYKGIVLSASRPFPNLNMIYQKNGIDTANLFFLDFISKSQGIPKQDADNVLYLDSVADLTNTAIAINEAIKIIQGKKFVFVDSITTMLIYNNPTIFARFVHSMLTRMRMNGIAGFLLSIENETNKEIRAEIAQLCDQVIRI